MNRTGKRIYRVMMPVGVAIAIVFMGICLYVMPTGFLAQNNIKQIRTVLKLNDDEGMLGSVKKSDIRIPNNSEEAEYNGETSKKIEWNSDELKSDLVYRSVKGGCISLNKGDNVNISVAFGKEYRNVFLYILGKDIVEKIGTLNESTPYSFTAEVSGQYMIYAGEEKRNITKDVGIGMEYSCSLN